jgi:Xaa-Pro aminopeptidase
MAWPINAAGLSPSDEAYLQFVESHKGRHSVNALYALKRAVSDAGLASGVVGSDDPRVGAWLGEVGLTGLRVCEATSIFREIRMVKTVPELELLRAASRMNEAALDAVLGQLHAGQQRSDLEVIYNIEIAKRGGRGIYLNTGQRGKANNLGEVVEDQSITFDALCEFKNYHGDLGRVAICGEPRPDLVKRMKAVELGCEIAYGMIKPGVNGRIVTEAVLNGVRKAGFEGFFFATPHSIGLEHSDQPLPIGPQFPGAQGEFIYLENMVFSIDMPYLEIGWGNLHVEDAVRVTSDGVEMLTSGDVSLGVLPRDGLGRRPALQTTAS